MSDTLTGRVEMRIVTLLVLILTLVISVLCETGNYTPIVLWHGRGESCRSPFMKALMNTLNTSLPNVYMLSLKIGSNIGEDKENSQRLHPDLQIKEACNIISSDRSLSGGFNAIGNSQGGQLMRGLVQRCPEAKVKNLITLGSQHQGIYGIPSCDSLSRRSCNWFRMILNKFVYYKWVQNSVVPATYWHDPLHENTYKKYSTFLADINNEININGNYTKNLQSLKNFVMVKYWNDTMIQPVVTEWFGFYKPGQSVETQSLQESALFLEDRLGLQEMNSQSKLHFLGAEGDHKITDWDWFVESVVKPFLE